MTQAEIIERAAVRAFRAACVRLRSIPQPFSIYVENDTIHLMRGPSHSDGTNPQPLHANIVDSESGVRISGGAW